MYLLLDFPPVLLLFVVRVNVMKQFSNVRSIVLFNGCITTPFINLFHNAVAKCGRVGTRQAALAVFVSCPPPDPNGEIRFFFTYSFKTHADTADSAQYAGSSERMLRGTVRKA